VLTPDQLERREKSERGGKGVLAFMQGQRALMKQAGFSGEAGAAHYVNLRGYPGSGSPMAVMAAQDATGKVLEAGRLWRWASVTKQVTAVLVMQEVAAKRIDLDQPVAKYLPAFKSPNARRLTVRQLLRHQSGLPDPDDTPANADGVPSYYTSQFSGSRDPLTGFCAGQPKAKPGGNWSYNNCDYIVAGALLEAVTGKTWQQLVSTRIRRTFANRNSTSAFTAPLVGVDRVVATQPTVEPWPGYVGGKREAKRDIASYGAAGGLYGTIGDLLWFDIYLAAGAYLPQAAMKELWDGRPELGFLALGQWSFSAKLKGCKEPLRIIERRGAIGGVQVRNFILPEPEIAVALFTDQAEFDFGEIWQGAGFSYDMLSLAACPPEKP